VDMDRRVRTTVVDTADTDRTCLTTADTLPITAGDGAPCPTMEVEEVVVVPLLQLLPLLLAAAAVVDTADLDITLHDPLLTSLL